MGFYQIVDNGAEGHLAEGDVLTTDLRMQERPNVAAPELALLSGVSAPACVQQCTLDRLTSRAGGIR